MPPVLSAVRTSRGIRSSDAGDGAQLRLTLLERFTLSVSDGGISLARGSERLIAFLALRHRPSRRTVVAGTLWPDSDDSRAHASLRSALSRLQGVGCHVVESRQDSLGLAQEVTVDLVENRAIAHRIVDGNVRASDVEVASILMLSMDLLPDWYDDWVILEAEDWRQLRLHALEALSLAFTNRGRHVDAVAAACAAVRGDPLRESARTALVRAHMAEHNQSEAVREVERYRRLLREELGLDPSADFVCLVGESAKT